MTCWYSFSRAITGNISIMQINWELTLKNQDIFFEASSSFIIIGVFEQVVVSIARFPWLLRYPNTCRRCVCTLATEH